jgi:hypothetical protein
MEEQKLRCCQVADLTKAQQNQNCGSGMELTEVQSSLFGALSPLFVFLGVSGSPLAGSKQFWAMGRARAAPPGLFAAFGRAEHTGTAVLTVTEAASQGCRCWYTESGEFTGIAAPGLGAAGEREDHNSGNEGRLI